MFILLTVYGRIHTRGVTRNDQEIPMKQNLLITFVHKPSSPLT